MREGKYKEKQDEDKEKNEAKNERQIGSEERRKKNPHKQKKKIDLRRYSDHIDPKVKILWSVLKPKPFTCIKMKAVLKQI